MQYLDKLGSSVYSKDVLIEIIENVMQAAEDDEDTGARLQSSMSTKQREERSESFLVDFFKEDKAEWNGLSSSTSMPKVHQKEVMQELGRRLAKERAMSRADVNARKRSKALEQ